MSSSEIREFLEDEILEIGNTITYRVLSRRMNIHVNVAKNELARFFEENRSTLSAIYMLSGLTLHSSTVATGPDVMDVDVSYRNDVTANKILLVSHEALEESRAEFIELRSCHIYSVSSKPQQTARSLCETMEQVRIIDTSLDTTSARKLGKIVGNEVNATGKLTVSSTTKTAKVTTSKPAGSSKPSASTEVKKEQVIESEKKKAMPLKPRMSGTLDWSKAKEKKKDGGKVNAEIKSESSVKLETGAKEEPEETSLRGTKRKSDVITNKKEQAGGASKGSPIPEIKREERTSLRVKNGVVLSEDEGESRNSRTLSTKHKGRTYDSDSEPERSVRALMDIDDSKVVKVARHNTAVPRPSPETEVAMDTSAEDQVDAQHQEDQNVMEDDSDHAPKTKPKKRAPKKSVPLGRNGYPKKRVIKTRMSKDARGYMASEDYSDYESVDDEEGAAKKEEEEKAKEARKKKRTSTLAKKPVKEEMDSGSEIARKVPEPPKPEKKVVPKPLAKNRASTGGQKSLTSFFGSSSKGK